MDGWMDLTFISVEDTELWDWPALAAPGSFSLNKKKSGIAKDKENFA